MAGLVLVVDADPEVRSFVDHLAPSLGLAVTLVGDVASARHHLMSADVAVVIAGAETIQAEEGDEAGEAGEAGGVGGVGLAFLLEVRQRWPRCARILSTRSGDFGLLYRAVHEARVADVLRVPWTLEALVEVLSALATERSPTTDLLLPDGGEVSDRHAKTVDRLWALNRALSHSNSALSGQVRVADRTASKFRGRWELVLNAISDAVIVIDKDFRLLDANDAARRVSAAMGTPAASLCHEMMFRRDDVCMYCPLWNGDDGTVDLGMLSSSRQFEVHAYPVPGDAKAHLCIYHDVTEEVAFRTKSAHVEKMAAIGRLAGGVAHELNNPLHAIMAFSKLAQQKMDRPEKLGRYLEVIRESADRCSKIVRSLRDFSRTSSEDEYRRIDVWELCVGVVEVFRALDSRTIELVDGNARNARNAREGQDGRADTTADGSGLFCIGNRNELQQVLVNLVQNALDASAKDGRVQIRTTTTMSEETSAPDSTGLESDGLTCSRRAWIEIAVDDQGPGVAIDARDRVFELFYTTKPEGVGTGLGLAICESIAKRHQGALSVEDSPELGGARFVLRLPTEPQIPESTACGSSLPR